MEAQHRTPVECRKTQSTARVGAGWRRLAVAESTGWQLVLRSAAPRSPKGHSRSRCAPPIRSATSAPRTLRTMSVAPFGLITTQRPRRTVRLACPIRSSYSHPAENSSIHLVGSSRRVVATRSLSCQPSGVISGTPTQAGTFSSPLTATHSGGLSINFTFSLRVSTLAITGPAIFPPGSCKLSIQPYFRCDRQQLDARLECSRAAGRVLDGTKRRTERPDNGVSRPSRAPIVTVSRWGLDRLPSSHALSSTRPIRRCCRGQSRAHNSRHHGRTDVYIPVESTRGCARRTRFAVAPGSSLPPGLQLVSGALLPPNFAPGITLIAGVPNAAGAYTFNLIATDSAGTQLRRTFSPKSVVHLDRGGRHPHRHRGRGLQPAVHNGRRHGTIHLQPGADQHPRRHVASGSEHVAGRADLRDAQTHTGSFAFALTAARRPRQQLFHPQLQLQCSQCGPSVRLDDQPVRHVSWDRPSNRH